MAGTMLGDFVSPAFNLLISVFCLLNSVFFPTPRSGREKICYHANAPHPPTPSPRSGEGEKICQILRMKNKSAYGLKMGGHTRQKVDVMYHVPTIWTDRCACRGGLGRMSVYPPAHIICL